MIKAESNSCKLPSKKKSEQGEVKEEATVSLAAAKETSVDAAIAAVLSEPSGIFTLRKEQRMALWAFYQCDVFASLPTAEV